MNQTYDFCMRASALHVSKSNCQPTVQQTVFIVEYKSLSQTCQLRSHCVRRHSWPQCAHMCLCLHSPSFVIIRVYLYAVRVLLFSQHRACRNRTLISDGFTMSDTGKPPLAVTQCFLNSTAAAATFSSHFWRVFLLPHPLLMLEHSLYSHEEYITGDKTMELKTGDSGSLPGLFLLCLTLILF